MQVSVEDLGGLERRLNVQVPAEQIDKEVQNRLQSLTRRVRLDGFRPGKVPLKVVKRMYGPQVRQEVVGDVLQSSFQDALAEQELRPAGRPSGIEPKVVEEGKDLEYSATFEVLPQIDIRDLENIQVERPVAEVTEADVDNMIDTLRKQRTQWNQVERPSQESDRVTVDFEGKLDGEDFPGNQGSDMQVVLGSGRMLPDFEQGLRGVQTGQEAEFDVTFPEDYQAKELAGKTAHFKVQVKAVEESVLPEVDDAFVQSFGVEEGGIEGLRKAVRENMERELKEGIQNAVKRQVMDGLLKANDITVPRVMVQEEIDRLAQQAGFPAEQADAQIQARKSQLFANEAQRRVALGLLISKLVADNQIKPDQQRVMERLQSIAATYQDTSEVLQWYQQTPHALEGLQALALEDQVVDWLLERAQVSERPSSFEQVMRPASAAAVPSGGADEQLHEGQA
ncbi:MAG: trigger factor [Candidatus Competibacteraceae bacterium]|nr:trigger factor [Candidatus Competibacteraceae bacterium]